MLHQNQNGFNSSSYCNSTATRFEKFCCLLLFHCLILTDCSSVSSSENNSNPIWTIKNMLHDYNIENNNTFHDVKFNVGESAFLPCSFPPYSRNHEGSVSWFRRRDWQILSAGVYININDDRFAVLHREGSDEWTLQIKFAKFSDNGTYECQVHTGSGFLSQFVNLSVVQPRAAILGARHIHVSTGDTFSLTCIIEEMLSTPVYVMWLHRNIPLNYAPDRPRLTVHTKPRGVHTSSTLTVVDARYEDSGNYSCETHNARAAHATVYISEGGDSVAAVQPIKSENSSQSQLMFTSSLTPIFILSSTVLVNIRYLLFCS